MCIESRINTLILSSYGLTLCCNFVFLSSPLVVNIFFVQFKSFDKMLWGFCPTVLGQKKVVVLRVQVLKLVWIPFGGAAPWSSAVMRAASWNSGIFELLGFFSARPSPGVRRIWVRLLWRMVQQVFAAAPTASAVFSSEAVHGDFPSATWWAPTIQRLGSFSIGASGTSSVSSSSSGSRGLRCNF
jgi:hypothetical protein